MNKLTFDQNLAIYKGNHFELVQMGKDQFSLVVNAFLKNYYDLVSNQGIKDTPELHQKEIAENAMLQPNSIALALLHKGSIIATAMITKRMDFAFNTETYFGLSIKNVAEKLDKGGGNIYYISKVSTDNSFFKNVNREHKHSLIKLCLKVLFEQMLQDHLSFAISNLNEYSSGLTYKIGLTYTRETEPKLLRGINHYGVTFSAVSVQSFCESVNTEEILCTYF